MNRVATLIDKIGYSNILSKYTKSAIEASEKVGKRNIFLIAKDTCAIFFNSNKFKTSATEYITILAIATP